MRKIAIMQPYLFPYIGYFQLISAVDEFVILDDVNYIKRGWINRNNVLINKEKKLFIVPIKSASSNKLIKELEIGDDFDKFQKMVKISYSKAPYFPQVFKLIESICYYPDKNLARFVGNSLERTSSYLKLGTVFSYSSEIKKDKGLKGQDKIISICKELGATGYINLIGGLDLYSKDEFRQKDIELKFIKPQIDEYKQFGDKDFIPGLSIIDILMFNSPENVKKMLESYELL